MIKIKNKIVLTVIFTVLAISIAGISYFYFSRSRLISPVGNVSITVTPIPTIEPLALWEDQSEFSFQYPQSLKLDPHEEDKENYAHIELTSANHSGNLIVWTQDTKAMDNDDWIKREKIQGAIDTTLASLPAKKFLTGDSPKILTTMVIRNGYLYKIESMLSDSEFWNKVYATVSSSFEFTGDIKEADSQPIQPQVQQSGAEEATEEYEEVVE